MTCWFEVELTNPFGRAERFAVDVPKGEKELRVVTSAEEWQHLRRNVPVGFGTVGEGAVESNPFGRAERFAVDVPKGEKELRVVTSAEEWQHLRRNVPVAFGTVGQGAVEADMIDGSGPPGAPPMVLLMARETVRIPF